MKSFLRYSKNRFLYNLLKFLIIGLLAFFGFSYFSTMKVDALTFNQWSYDSSQAFFYYSSFPSTTNQIGMSGSVTSGTSSFTLNPNADQTGFSWFQYRFNLSNTISLQPGYSYTFTTNYWFDPIIQIWGGLRVHLRFDGGTGYFVSCPVRDNTVVCSFTPTEHINTNYISFAFTRANGSDFDFTGPIYLTYKGGIKISYDTTSSEILNTQKEQLQEQKETNDKLDVTNKNLTDSNTSGAKDDADNFFSGFTTDTYGLTSIITSPLTLIGNITSSTCSPLGIPLPYVNSNLTLPCMSDIYTDHFGTFLTIYQTITFGIVAYWVSVRVFNLVKDFKNPDHDEIEVMDL